MPLCAFDIHPDGTTTPVDDTALTGTGSFRWWHFDMNEPGLRDWVDERVPEIPANALLQSETRPRCDRYGDGIILNLRGINMNSGQDSEDMISLRMWVTRTAIVSVRVRKVFAINDLKEACENGEAPANVPAFLVALLNGLTSRIESTMLEEDEATDALEEAVLSSGLQGKGEDIPIIRRKVIKLRRYLSPQREAVSKLANLDSPVIDDTARSALREPANRTILVVEGLEAIKDRLTALQDFTDAQTAARLGKNSYGLSVIAAVFLPLGFLTGLFGVNVGGMPGIDNPWAFPILSAAMIFIAIFAIILLRKVNWL